MNDSDRFEQNSPLPQSSEPSTNVPKEQDAPVPCSENSDFIEPNVAGTISHLSEEIEEGSEPQPVTAPLEAPIRTELSPGDPPLFQNWSDATPSFWSTPRNERIPNMGHLAFLGLLIVASLLVVGVLTNVALHFHLYGVSSVKEAVNDIHYTLGSMAALYLLAFAASLLLFPLFWHKSLFAGLQWNGSAALRHRQKLLSTAAACFVFAIINGIFLPGPSDTPIDKIFRSPGAAWLLFGFGVTFAPFFEELVFRGFLLPALSTAFDWVNERASGVPTREPDENGHPRWSFPAVATGSVLTSLLFAAMHAEQTGYSIGPFLMLVAVSLVLCWVRLSTRSLAASVLVHACYNFMLFTMMLIGTEGFQNLNKM